MGMYTLVSPSERRRNDYPIIDILEKPFPFTYNDWLENIIQEVDPKFFINKKDDIVYMEEETETLNEQIKDFGDPKMTNKYIEGFWPKYRNQLYRQLYDTYHPSAYNESFSNPSGNFENALDLIADAVHDGKKLGLLDSSVDWSDTVHYDFRGNSDTKFNKEKEEWEDTKRVIDDNGIPTLNDQLEIMDNTNLDWIHGILLFDVLEDIVDEFKHYCGENGIDESGMGKCMEEFPPSPNHEQINRTGGTLKQDYYTLFNFMRELERVGNSG